MTTLTLFHSPNSCSEGIAILLRVINAPHDVVTVNLAKRDHLTPDFLAKNPKGKVPALLRSDGTILTEFTAIAFWLAKAFPEAGLIGPTLEDEARALEIVDFVVASIHMRGFTFVKVPQKFIPDPEGQDVIRNHGRAEVTKGLGVLSETLGDKDYLLGAFGIADAAAYYVLRWAEQEKFDLPSNLNALLRRINLWM